MDPRAAVGPVSSLCGQDAYAVKDTIEDLLILYEKDDCASHDCNWCYVVATDTLVANIYSGSNEKCGSAELTGTINNENSLPGIFKKCLCKLGLKSNLGCGQMQSTIKCS